MAQSDSRFGYQAKLSRVDHNLSRAFGFTCAPGMLCPIFADVATPGDRYYVHHDLDFLRTAPLLAPSMIDVKVHFETFFVPVQMVYEPAENTLFSLNSFRSSLYSDPALLNQAFPVLNFKYYVNDMLSRGATSTQRMLAFRFADFMGYNPYAFCVDNYVAPTQEGSVDFTGSCPMFYFPNFFPWKALVYHTIFNYYYRLDDKSQFRSTHCNWDQYYATTVVDISYNSNVFSDQGGQGGLFTIYQRPWDFDYFTSLYRSPIVSDANVQSVLATGYYSDLIQIPTKPITSVGGNPSSNSSTNSFSPSLTSTSGLAASLAGSTAMIRQAFANEKLAMITGRTRKNYDSQVLAHYGIKVPHDVKHDITLIGRDTYQLRVGEVTSLATTKIDDKVSPLGELAGKGWASGQGKEIKFTAPCHGFIMTIFSIEPKRRYGVSIERNSMISSAFDLPVPEFDRLGNQPMFGFEQGVYSQSDIANVTNLIGWKERYYWWKRNFDKVSLAFMPVVSSGVSVPQANNYQAFFLSYFPFGRKTTNFSFPSLERSFYIDRGCLNDQFAAYFENGWLDNDSESWTKYPFKVYQRDPFIVNSNVKVTKVSWLSKDGEPVYNF